MDLINSVLKIVSAAVIGGGTLIAAFNGIGLGTALKNHNGPDIQNNLWGLAGGAVIIIVGALISSVSFT